MKELTEEIIDYLNNDNIKKDGIFHFRARDISSEYILPEDIIRRHHDKLNWNDISRHQRLSEEFIIEFEDKVDWTFISSDQVLSESFIRKYKDKVKWSWISIIQKLSEEFIREFEDKIDFYSYLGNKEMQNSSKELQMLILEKVINVITDDIICGFYYQYNRFTPYMQEQYNKFSFML
jgi:hypothetical protein